MCIEPLLLCYQTNNKYILVSVLFGLTFFPTYWRLLLWPTGFGWYVWDRPSHCSGEFRWIHCERGQIPHNAVHAGRDKDGGPLYAGRAYHDGSLLPAKVAPHHHQAYVPYGGREHAVHQFEVNDVVIDID